MNEIDIAFLVAVYSEVVVATAKDLSLQGKLQEQIDFLDDYKNKYYAMRHSLLVDFPSDLGIDLIEHRELSAGDIKLLVSNIEQLPRSIFESRKSQKREVSSRTLKFIKRDLGLNTIEDVIDRLLRFHLFLHNKYNNKATKEDIVIYAYLSDLINKKSLQLKEIKSYYNDEEKSQIFEGVAPYKEFSVEEFADNLKRFPFYRSFPDGSEYFIYEERDDIMPRKEVIEEIVNDHLKCLYSNDKSIQAKELARMANFIFQTLYTKCDTTYKFESYENECDYYMARVGVVSVEELITFYTNLQQKLKDVDVNFDGDRDIRLNYFYQSIDKTLTIYNKKIPDIKQIIMYLNTELIKDFLKVLMTRTRKNPINLTDLQKRCTFMSLDDVQKFKEQALSALKKRGIKTSYDLDILENVVASFELIESQKLQAKDLGDYTLKFTSNFTQA